MNKIESSKRAWQSSVEINNGGEPVPVLIDSPGDRGHAGGGDRHSLTVRPESREIATENGDGAGGDHCHGGGRGQSQKISLEEGNVSGVVVDGVQPTTSQKTAWNCWKSPPRKSSSPMAIATKAKVRASFKWKISAMGSCQGDEMRLIGSKKIAWKTAVVRETQWAKAIADSNFVGAGGGNRYESIAEQEAITIVLVQWPDEGCRFAGGGSKWRWWKGYKIISKSWEKLLINGWLWFILYHPNLATWWDPVVWQFVGH